MTPTLIAFVGYLAFMLLVGAFFMRRSSGKLDEYLLGGRGIGSWVTALSAQASDMSGWILMGLPGAIYMISQTGGGWGDIWCAIGLWAGTFLNWIFVAPRLRVYSEKTASMTITGFISKRVRDPSGVLRLLGAVATLLFFTVYVSTGLVAAGKLFESMFHINYRLAVSIGAVVILAYTFMGGYLAVCWTDLVQGGLMFFALVAVPLVVVIANPDVNFMQDLATKNLAAFPNGFTMAAFVSVISALVWGLGYFGQPHILTRFMSISNVREFPKATTIAMVWVTISLSMAAVIALVAMPDAITQVLWSSAPDAKEAEKIFINMIARFFNPWVGGVLLAALLAAIMSTIDSQLLVCSSTLTEDIYKCIGVGYVRSTIDNIPPEVLKERGIDSSKMLEVFNRYSVPEKNLVLLSRIFVVIISVLALGIALMDLNTIFVVVKFAWGGFGAAFGPVILFSLYSRKLNWKGAVAGMFVGMVTMLIWYFLGHDGGEYFAWMADMYEIFPGFVAGCAAIAITNAISPETDPAILAEFDSVVKTVKNRD